MRLFIGGRCQGKLEYVLARADRFCGGENAVIADGEEYPLEEPETADILNHFHLLIKRLEVEGREVCPYAERLLDVNPQITIICDEVGMGIVPVDDFERRYRESVGRCLCMLAQRAESVERIVCGRGMKIK